MREHLDFGTREISQFGIAVKNGNSTGGRTYIRLTAHLKGGVVLQADIQEVELRALVLDHSIISSLETRIGLLQLFVFPLKLLFTTVIIGFQRHRFMIRIIGILTAHTPATVAGHELFHLGHSDLIKVAVNGMFKTRGSHSELERPPVVIGISEQAID